ncbi:MAG: Re/Si-specific NAD(P)(+) transhydrogenase subunit alpha [Spirochaetaceae bacterium]|nr:MAG: Re/Si-specific NAD(P)(+) transhydrogenase subunit alpha [Spirochaetaceae bacterium]
MIVGVLKETAPGEKRVAVIPAHVSLLAKLGCEVKVEKGAGVQAGYADSEYEEKGAVIADRASITAGSQIVSTVRCASGADGGADLDVGHEGQVWVGIADPFRSHASFDTLVKQKGSLLSMELIPRITRAQSMDVLSSMANLAGYQAVLTAATTLPKMFPMMMTAAGTIVPAKVFIVGVGVAGLQAIATAQRLGAIVSAYDVRSAAKEQAESLGAKFVQLDLGEGAEGSGGYAKEMDEAFYEKQREMMKSVLADSDVVITTAAVPGKPAPRLVTEEMVAGMQPNSVIIDLGAERGGNCELTRPGETVTAHGVTIVGPLNLVSQMAGSASQLYSKNMVTYLQNVIADGELTLDLSDEITDATLVIHNGEIRGQYLKSAYGKE